MTTIILGVIIFLDILQYIIFADVILSWLMLFGIRFRPKILVSIVGPMYALVKKYIPTSFGAFDFTPIVIILLIVFLKGLLMTLFPEAQAAINSLAL